MSRVIQVIALGTLAAAFCRAQAASEADAEFAKLEPAIERAQAQWEKSPEARAAQVDWTITRGLVVQRRMTGGNRFDGKRAVDVDLEHEEAVRFGIHDRFSISTWVLPIAPTGAIVARGKDIADSQGYGLFLKDGKAQVNLVRHWPDDALRVETESTIAMKQWHNITMTYDGSGAAAGVCIYTDGQRQKLKSDVDRLQGTFETKEPLWIGAGDGPENRFRGQIRMVRLYRRVLAADEVTVIATETPVNTIALSPSDKRTPGETEKIRLYFLERAAPPDIREAWQRVIETRDK